MSHYLHSTQIENTSDKQWIQFSDPNSIHYTRDSNQCPVSYGIQAMKPGLNEGWCCVKKLHRPKAS